MGLDNGIRIKNVRIEDIKVPWFVDKRPWYQHEPEPESEHEEERELYVEVIYWRKCWGIRNAIMNKFHFIDDKKSVGKYLIEFEDIPALYRVLTPFMDKQYYEDNADSIWDYDDYSEHLQNDILTLLWLGEFMLEHPDAEVYFYDSY